MKHEEQAPASFVKAIKVKIKELRVKFPWLAGKTDEEIQLPPYHGERTGTYNAKIELSLKGQYGMKVRWSERQQVLDDILKQLAKRRRMEDLRAHELWDPFFAALDEKQLNPIETIALDDNKNSNATYEYGDADNRQNITFGTFQNRLSALTKKSR